jgi:hypothetical protein
VSIKDEEAEADSEAEKLSPLLDASAEPVACSSPVHTSRGDKRSSLNATTVLSSPTEYYPSNALPSDEKVNTLHFLRLKNVLKLLSLQGDNVRAAAPAISAGNTPVRAPGTPLSAATSHRSSGDSFSSSSSTRQLLPPIAVLSGNAGSASSAITASSGQPPEASKSLDDIAMV